MARLTGFVGDVTGRMGNMVAFVRRGENFARKYQPNVTNPNTARQQRSREIFRYAYELSASFAPAVLMGYSGVNPTYERQAFVGKTISGQLIEIDARGDVEINFGFLPISEGPLVPLPTSIRPTFGTAGSVKFPVSADDIDDANLLVDGVTPINCLVFGVVFSPSEHRAVMDLVAVKEIGGRFNLVNEGAVKTPVSWAGEQVHTYVFCKQSPTPRNGIPLTQLPPRIRFAASKSTYLGEGMVG